MKNFYLTILLEEWSKGVATLGAVKLDHEQLGHNSWGRSHYSTSFYQLQNYWLKCLDTIEKFRTNHSNFNVSTQSF